MLLLGVVLAWAVFAVAFRSEPLVNNRWNGALVAIPLAVGASLASGSSHNTVSDRDVYLRHFERLAAVGSPGDLSESSDPLFDWLLWAMAHTLPTTETVLFTTLGLILAAGTLWASSRLLPTWAVIGSFLTLIASGLFTAYTSVAVRQGVAIALLVPALVLAATHRRARVMLALCVCAPLLHWTAVAPALAVVAVRFLSLRVAPVAWGWAALAVAFVLGAQQRLLGGLTAYLPAIDEYASSATLRSYGGGVNRLDFLALSAAILVGALIARRWLRDDPIYDRLVVGYTLFNAVFLLLGFIPFSDRLAAYSWFVAPLLAWYAIAKWSEQRKGHPIPLMALLGVIAMGVLTGSLAAVGAVMA